MLGVLVRNNNTQYSYKNDTLSIDIQCLCQVLSVFYAECPMITLNDECNSESWIFQCYAECRGANRLAPKINN
jgi:hypothetical protein